MPKRQRRPRAIDLFCGAGGLTVGLKQAGFQVIGAVECDDVASETYKRNHRSVVVWSRDIRRLPASHVRKALGLRAGDLDLLAGCPPCQGFSTMRTLNRGSSVRDERNRLIYDFLRFARVLRPKSIMLENVPGLGEGNRIKRFCDALTRLGYNWEQRVVNAADYGVPQRRRRFLLLASRVGAVALPTPTAQASTVREAIGDLPVPKKSDDTLHNLPEQRAPHVRALIRQIPKNGGSRSSLPKSLQLDCHIRSNGFYDVYGRMSWDDVAPTITSGCTNPSKGRFLHPTQNRAITLREAALLQTFPTSYFFSLKRGKEHVAAMIGNALPPRMIKAFATTVRGKVLRRPRRRGKVSRSNGIKAHGAT